MTWIDVVQKLSASFAFIVGGIWVLMNYIRNRTHVPRLQLEVTAEIIRGDSVNYLLSKCTATNVGLSVIHLARPQSNGVGLRGTALLVKGVQDFDEEQDVIEAEWDEWTAAFDIFTEHRSIEPALAISEEKLIWLDTSVSDAYRVRLRVSAHDEKWTAVAVAVREKGKTNENVLC